MMDYLGWLLVLLLAAAVIRFLLNIGRLTSKSSYELELEKIQKRKAELGIEDPEQKDTPEKKNGFTSFLVYVVCIVAGVLIGLIAISLYLE